MIAACPPNQVSLLKEEGNIFNKQNKTKHPSFLSSPFGSFLDYSSSPGKKRPDSAPPCKRHSRVTRLPFPLGRDTQQREALLFLSHADYNCTVFLLWRLKNGSKWPPEEQDSGNLDFADVGTWNLFFIYFLNWVGYVGSPTLYSIIYWVCLALPLKWLCFSLFRVINFSCSHAPYVDVRTVLTFWYFFTIGKALSLS